jgi:hypothetical protein
MHALLGLPGCAVAQVFLPLFLVAQVRRRSDVVALGRDHHDLVGVYVAGQVALVAP